MHFARPTAGKRRRCFYSAGSPQAGRHSRNTRWCRLVASPLHLINSKQEAESTQFLVLAAFCIAVSPTFKLGHLTIVAKVYAYWIVRPFNYFLELPQFYLLRSHYFSALTTMAAAIIPEQMTPLTQPAKKDGQCNDRPRKVSVSTRKFRVLENHLQSRA